jgi:hypothetical protein
MVMAGRRLFRAIRTASASTKAECIPSGTQVRLGLLTHQFRVWVRTPRSVIGSDACLALKVSSRVAQESLNPQGAGKIWVWFSTSQKQGTGARRTRGVHGAALGVQRGQLNQITSTR